MNNEIEVINEEYDKFDREKQTEKERKKKFKFVKSYENFDLYIHKTKGYKECFSKMNVSKSK
jgi:hypothetical protein